MAELIEIDKHKIYLWEIIFVILIPVLFGFVGANSNGIDFSGIWEIIFPYVFWVNVVGVIVAIFMFVKYLDVKKQIKAIENEQKAKADSLFLWVNDKPKTNPKWERIEKLSTSGNQSDWRVAILEADSMLDELIQKLGFDGENMGERMLTMNNATFPYLSEAWRVHKLRNIVAHETSYDLQRGEVEDAIDAYNLIFKSHGLI